MPESSTLSPGTRKRLSRIRRRAIPQVREAYENGQISAKRADLLLYLPAEQQAAELKSCRRPGGCGWEVVKGRRLERPGRPLIAGTCETLAQLDFGVCAHDSDTNFSLYSAHGERSARPCADVKDDVSCLVMPTRHNAIDRGTMVSFVTNDQLRL